MVLALFETAAGFALFRVLDDGSLADPDSLAASFASSPCSAPAIVRVSAFKKFKSTAEAFVAAAALADSTLSKPLKKFLKAEIIKKSLTDSLVVGEPKLGAAISKKLGIFVLPVTPAVHELFRGIRANLDSLIAALPGSALAPMALALSHSLSRHKLKLSADKVDAMVVQAVTLLDDLDKEINTYAMRVKEWYGWHFPELAKLVVDSLAYAKVAITIGSRSTLFESPDAVASILPEDIDMAVRAAAAVSTGTDITSDDLVCIRALCTQVIDLHEYRLDLSAYLTARMQAIAPNLTALLGDLIGARLIAHAGSLMTLARHPASTIQILGAERALFRALKAKKDTPKYGLLYHATLVNKAQGKNKGKIARVLATKAALAVRVDAHSDEATSADSISDSVGVAGRLTVEKRLRDLESRDIASSSGNNTGLNKKHAKYTKPAKTTPSYNSQSDFTSATSSEAAKPQVRGTKRPHSSNDENVENKNKKQKNEEKEEKEEKEEEQSVAVENGNQDEYENDEE